MVTADLKADEPALHALADMLMPLRVFEREELAVQTSRLETPSDENDEIVHGVAEAAACRGR